jgi:hypothetical protein
VACLLCSDSASAFLKIGFQCTQRSNSKEAKINLWQAVASIALVISIALATLGRGSETVRKRRRKTANSPGYARVALGSKGKCST